jgi:hypothetical protein
MPAARKRCERRGRRSPSNYPERCPFSSGPELRELANNLFGVRIMDLEHGEVLTTRELVASVL